MAKKLALDVGPARHEIELSETADGAFTMLVNDVPHTVALERINASNLHRLTIDGHGMDIVIARRGGGLTVAVGPASHQVSILRAGARRPLSSPGLTEGELAVHAPLHGTVVELLVAPGDRVAKDDPLLVLVAMKMNNEIRAPAPGTVTAVHVQPQDAVEQGAVLLLLHIDADPTPHN